MLRKCVCFFLTLVLLTSSSVCSFGARKDVTATIPSFSVSLNGLTFENNEREKYPLLVYKNITYFPMTYYKSNLLNLETTWTKKGGLVVKKGNSATAKEFAYESLAVNSSSNNKKQKATIINSKVVVNGKTIDNMKETYPLLLFRDVTYFPLTWRFAVEEFGWNYTFDKNNGLRITADNFFYTANGDSYKKTSGESVLVPNETYYIKDDLMIYIKTDYRLIGPLPQNLHIIKNGIEATPVGYFGYYQKNGPLFSIDEGYISTTYYSDPDERDAQPCKVNIETGRIL